jgi:methyl-accepting chemotaxis protein
LYKGGEIVANQSIDTLQININASAKTSQKAIDDLCQSLTKLRNGLKGLNNRSVNISTGIKQNGTAARRASSGFDALTSAFQRNRRASTGLLGTIGKLYATFWALQKVFGWVKNSINFASELTEVQNVVRNAFGPESEKMVNDFAGSISILNFGMSELTTKQIASKFQAMGKALGVSNEQVVKTQDTIGQLPDMYDSAADSMADVSLNLTKLAADMGSFYNKEADEVAKSLEAVFTGQTRPLTKSLAA